MSEYTPRRLKSAKIKADQLKATGAKIVVTTCHNCVDGLTDLIKHYKLDMEVTQLVNLVAKALVVTPKVEEVPVEAVPVAAEAPSLTGLRILVADDEPDFVTFISTVLEDNGAAVLRATLSLSTSPCRVNRVWRCLSYCVRPTKHLRSRSASSRANRR